MHVQRAKALPSPDVLGRADPLVKVFLNGQVRQTKPRRETLDPEWDEYLEFRGELGDFAAASLKLRVSDADPVGKDDLGECTVKLKELKTEDTVEFGQKLTTVGRMPSSGVLEFEVTWLQRHEEDD